MTTCGGQSEIHAQHRCIHQLYEGEHEYSYIDPEDVRILARNPIV